MDHRPTDGTGSRIIRPSRGVLTIEYHDAPDRIPLARPPWRRRMVTTFRTEWASHLRRSALLTLIVACGCATTTTSEDRRPTVVHTLQMDPEQPPEVVGWWLSPLALLELTDDGRFRRWSSHDRFERPEETGRWHRDNHAVFWLEIYADPSPPRRRAALWYRDDVLMATIDRTPGAYRLSDGPPWIPADELLGVWTGEGGTIEFREDATYLWTSSTESGAPARIGGQRGRWRLDENRRLLIEPLLSDQTPAITSLVRDDFGTPSTDDDLVIEVRSSLGPMRRPGTEPDAATMVPVNPTAFDA